MTPPTRSLLIRIDQSLPSWNHFYAGMHFRARSALKSLWFDMVRAATLHQLGPRLARRKMVGQARIYISCEFSGRKTPIDPDNLCAKLAIDPLKGWILEDDSPEFIHSVTLGPCTRGDSPVTQIRIVAPAGDLPTGGTGS